MGHFGNAAMLGKDVSEKAVSQFVSSADLVKDFFSQIIEVALERLEKDLSCWVKTASVTLGSLLTEELCYSVIAVDAWQKHLEGTSNKNSPC